MFSNVTWVQLIGPIATLVATTIASICALWIATRVYRTQKQIDVQISHPEEKRRAFKQYFFAATDMHTELRAALYRGADGIGHFRLAKKGCTSYIVSKRDLHLLLLRMLRQPVEHIHWHFWG